MILDVLLAGVAVAVSLGVALAVLYALRTTPAQSRGMVGLASTVVHLLLSLGLPVLLWIVHNPSRPLVFMLSVLFFYWVSLIILVVTIIRWLRSNAATPAAVEPKD